MVDEKDAKINFDATVGFLPNDRRTATTFENLVRDDHCHRSLDLVHERS